MLRHHSLAIPSLPRLLVTRLAGLAAAVFFLASSAWADETAEGDHQTFTVILDTLTDAFDDVASNRSAYVQEIVATAFATHTLTPVFEQLPRLRARKMVREGARDCIAITPKLGDAKLIYADEPWGIHEMKLYLRKELATAQLVELDEAQGFNIGVIAGVSYDNSGAIDQAIAGSPNFTQVHGHNAFARLVQMAEKRFIDGFYACPFWLNSQKNVLNTELTDFHPVYDSGVVRGLYMACSADSEQGQAVIQHINQALRELRDDGRLRRILEKYGHDDWQGRI